MRTSNDLAAAVAELGSGHVEWLLRNWPARAEAAYRGAWAANHTSNRQAYARLLEAGPAKLRAALARPSI